MTRNEETVVDDFPEYVRSNIFFVYNAAHIVSDQIIVNSPDSLIDGRVQSNSSNKWTS